MDVWLVLICIFLPLAVNSFLKAPLPWHEWSEDDRYDLSNALMSIRAAAAELLITMNGPPEPVEPVAPVEPVTPVPKAKGRIA